MIIHLQQQQIPQTTLNNKCENGQDICYFIDVEASLYYSTEFETQIININDNTNTLFYIYYKIMGNKDCINPKISFELEKIDYDLSTEYIDIYDNSNTLIKICGGNIINKCGE